MLRNGGARQGPAAHAKATVGINLLNLEAIARAPVNTHPFSFFMVTGVLSAVDLAAVRADFPQISESGLFSVSETIYGPAFGKLIEDIRSRAFQSVMEKKYGVDLADKPMVISVCSWKPHRVGHVLMDCPDELPTCLLFLNKIFDDRGGCLSVLRANNDPGDDVAEIPLSGGTLASFLSADGSWHERDPDNGELQWLRLSWCAQKSCGDGVAEGTDQRNTVRSEGAS